ncbi:Flagellar hook-length control protein-like C-terminal domain-containing protein [Bordetella sputigena]|uniref:flagellar hook-length control protein FliK n=1 Tax=Bordetella sputigena TaxID=1416810 RepID=UPI0039F03820
MSIGPTALSSLLVQRLDAVLGTQLAQQGSTNTALRDAVIPPGGADGVRPDPQGRGNDQLGNLTGRERAALREAAEQAELAAALRSRFVSTGTTPSAPTTLGQTARVILTLLAQYPETAPALAGKAPLWSGDASADTGPDSAAQGPGARPGAAGAMPGEPRAVQQRDDGTQQDMDGQNQGAPGSAGSARDQAASGANKAAAANAALNAADDMAQLANGARPGAGAASSGAQGAEAARAAALPPGTPQPGPLAQALKQTIETSGLFYESHLSDVAYGQRGVAQLRGEPQAGLDASQAQNIQTPVPKQSILADNPRFNLPTSAAPTMAQADGTPAGGSAPTWSGSTPAHAPAAPPGIHPDATLLVRQQLEVLANQTLAWEGTAWPGTGMWWEIRREQRDAQAYMGDVDEPAAGWATRLVLTMPRLGTVEANISLSGQRLSLQIVAPESEREIIAGGADLRKRMEGAGLQLTQFTISAHAPDPEPAL